MLPVVVVSEERGDVSLALFLSRLGSQGQATMVTALAGSAGFSVVPIFM
jgi:hypothetical protein